MKKPRLEEKLATAIKQKTLRKTQSALTMRSLPTRVRMITATKSLANEAHRQATVRTQLGDIAKKQITQVVLQRQKSEHETKLRND